MLDPDDGDAYISADSFLYERCVVVANGRELYEQVLADPMAFPQDLEFESLLYVAVTAYERLTGEDVRDVLEDEPSYETFSNAEGWAPTEATRPGVFTGEHVPPLNRRPT